MVVLSRVADDTGSSVQNLLKLVGEGLGCTGENSVTVVHTRCYKGVDERSSGLGVERTSDPSKLAQPVEAHRASVRDETGLKTVLRLEHGHGQSLG